ncbi:MAG TPA: FAD:protein FMN transferase [Tepidisphaeraceae bacterium]|jgi:thiamine biosynthesis lipoprotein|nr:FAD:protein FMN transferase [Tepidisphaeraceae bacterium]
MTVAEPIDDVLACVRRRVAESVRRSARGDFRELSCRAMSTGVRILFHVRQPALADDFQHLAVEWIASFEATYSRFFGGSLVGRINSEAGGDWIELDDEAEKLFSACDRMHAISKGAFDPAALPLLRLWDWKADPPRVPRDAQVSAALELCGWQKVLRRPGAIRLPFAGMGIDLGGIGKEYAVDRLVELARARGIHDVMVDIGHDLRVSGTSPGTDAWYIGLEEPGEPGRCWTGIRVTDHAVATSGDYFRSFERNGRRYGHILDPRTGEPVNNGCEAVTVIAPNCTLAGVLSTAAYVLGPNEGIALIHEHGGVEACVTTTSARHQTRRFSAHVPH